MGHHGSKSDETIKIGVLWMVRFPEANTRLFARVFVCKRCKSKKRADNTKVLAGKVQCRKCGSSLMRIKKKGKKWESF